MNIQLLCFILMHIFDLTSSGNKQQTEHTNFIYKHHYLAGYLQKLKNILFRKIEIIEVVNI